MTALPALMARERGRSRMLVLAAGLTTLTYLLGSTLMGFSAWLIGRAAEHPDASVLSLAAVAVRATGLGRGLCRYAERLVGHDATLRSVADLRVDAYQGLATSRRPDVRSGAVLSAVVSDVDAVQDLWLRCVLPLAAGVLVSGVSVLACWLWLPASAVVLLVGLAVGVIVLPTLAALAGRAESATAELRAAHQVRTLDLLHGLGDLLAFGALPAARTSVHDAAAALAGLEQRTCWRTAHVAGLSVVLQGVTVAGVALVGLPAVQDGRLPRVGLGVVVLLAIAAFEPVGPLVDAGALLPRLLGSARRITELLSDRPAAHPDTAATSGALTLHHAGFRYPGTAGPALQGVDLTVRPGQVVAVVGASGAGKSTLLRAMTGQLVLTCGTATLGLADLACLSDERRARDVVLAEQQAYLFDATIRDNVRIGRPGATQDELASAAHLAGLTDWIEQLPLGWETRVGERGGQVSGGERKRIAVARAVLADTAFLLLDEPTEGLDAAAADALVRRLTAERRHQGILLVTHRLAALDVADEVVVLAGGQVVQRGTAASLAGLDGPYRGLEALATTQP